ncbi:MAG: hypothetical protein ACREBS_00435 [Nitrososphaerales archaeon]
MSKAELDDEDMDGDGETKWHGLRANDKAYDRLEKIRRIEGLRSIAATIDFLSVDYFEHHKGGR